MKRIDLFTIDIGGGHIAPAMALKEQFDLLGYKDLEVRVVNLGIELGMTFLRYIYKFYWNNALRYPPLINAFYRGADNPFLFKFVDRFMGITALPKFVRYLEKEKPDLVVSTYFSFTHFLELLKRVGQLDAVSVVLNPEPFDSHQIWFSQAFDWSMVFSQKSHDEIVEKGLPRSRLKVFSFPIKPSYAPRKESKLVLRQKLGLGQKPFTVLFFFGAEGVGPVKKFLATIIERGLSLQAVVICGRNEKLKADMDELAAGPTGSVAIKARGFVTNLSEYIAAADVVVGKSGPNQVFETLLQGRPIIISSFLANEKETTNWVIENKAGWLTRSPEHLATLLAKLAAHPEVLEEYRKSIAGLKLRSGAPEICQFLYGLVKAHTPAKKKTMGDALREFRDTVRAEGAALTARIDAQRDASRRKRATAKSARVSRTAARSVARTATRTAAVKKAAVKAAAKKAARGAGTSRAPGVKQRGATRPGAKRPRAQRPPAAGPRGRPTGRP
jgi:processive 1,2-diacylglycerol beta-glucosyltransferase